MIVIDTKMEEIIYIAILKLKSKNTYCLFFAFERAHFFKEFILTITVNMRFRLDVLYTVSPIANTLMIIS